jgi:hypothetical protein
MEKGPIVADGRFIAMVGRFSMTNGRFTATVGRFSMTDGRFTSMHGRFSIMEGRFTSRVDRFSMMAGRFIAANGPFSTRAGPVEGQDGRFSAMDAAMAYTREEVSAASGLPSRTIRRYIAIRLLPPATGHGLSATYDEAHFVRAVTIGRMRAEGKHISTIVDEIIGWSDRQFARYVAKTNPAPTAEPAAAPPELVSAEPVSRAALPSGKAAPLVPLPPVPSWRIFPLIRGMALMVDSSAAPAVQRMAAEILATYGESTSD